MPSTGRSVLIACVGNTLRTDDGVGPRIAEILSSREMPDNVDVEDFGIGGVHMVQALQANEYCGLVLVDCADRGKAPGTVMVIEPDVLDVHDLEDVVKYDYLADMHYTNPERAMALAKALRVLPIQTVLLGIQPVDSEKLGSELTPVVEAAAKIAADEAIRLAIEFMKEPVE